MNGKVLAITALITGLIAFSGCLGGGSGGATGPSQYATELEGTWVFTVTDTNFTYTSTWVFSDTNWTRTDVQTTDQTWAWNGTFSLNSAATPRTIDMLCAGSPDSTDIGLTAPGIYALSASATSCTLSVADFGDTVRPSDFNGAIVLTKQ